MLLSQTTNELKKNSKFLDPSKIKIFPNDRRIVYDSIKAFNSQNNIEPFSYKSDRLVSPLQMIQTRRLLEFNRAKSVAMNIHHTLVVK